ncbi:SGNH/GDSL hydrolase family protein [Mucilaginibacter sp.]
MMKIWSLILLLIVFSTVIFTGCTKKSADVNDGNYGFNDLINLKIVNTDTIRYLALGDSYTVGQSVSQSQSFPYQLTTALQALGFKPAQPTEIAITGWTSADLINGIAMNSPLQDNYDFVTLLIGVNDQRLGISDSVYRANFNKLLQTAVTYAKGEKGRVFVLSLPDYGVTPFANGQDAVIGPEIDHFNTINLQESENAKVNYYNITAISREAATNLSLLAADDLHPSAAMYAQWVQGLLPMVLARVNIAN